MLRESNDLEHQPDVDLAFIREQRQEASERALGRGNTRESVLVSLSTQGHAWRQVLRLDERVVDLAEGSLQEDAAVFFIDFTFDEDVDDGSGGLDSMYEFIHDDSLCS